MQQLHLALDWTPNINHIGFFVAQHKGFYEGANLDVTISDPSADNYAVTPAKKVELGQADFALCPMESIISYRTKTRPFPLQAIAAIFQEDVSAIAVLKNSSIKSPRDLDGKSYASYHARYEDAIVRQMIKNDGGQGNISIDYPAKLGIWETILQQKTDATWIFMNWEGIEATTQNVDLQCFKMADYGIPYSYSPVIAANADKIATHVTAYHAFLAATRQGYLNAVRHPAKAVEILQQLVPQKERAIDLQRCLNYSALYFGSINNWGVMEQENVQTFLDWIYQNELEKVRLTVDDLVTNDLL